MEYSTGKIVKPQKSFKTATPEMKKVKNWKVLGKNSHFFTFLAQIKKITCRAIYLTYIIILRTAIKKKTDLP